MERLTNIGSNGEIWITDNDETRRLGRKESAYKKLAEYEDLEERLNGVSVKQVVDGFIKTVENQTCEGYEHGRILTNAEADKWNEYKQLEEQGLLLRLPVKVGDTIWYVDDDDDNYPIEAKIIRIEIKENYVLYYAEEKEDCGTLGLDSDDIGKTVFLTKEEAEQKLKEMESD